jgi:hypothetical protein
MFSERIGVESNALSRDLESSQDSRILHLDFQLVFEAFKASEELGNARVHSSSIITSVRLNRWSRPKKVVFTRHCGRFCVPSI